MSEKLKIVFAGTPAFALPSLEKLTADKKFEIVAVFTRPDRPVGRGQKVVAPPIKVLAEKLGLPVCQKKLTAESLRAVANSELDFLVVVAFGQILPTAVLEIPQFGGINLHASLLPKFRGASPIASAILAGENETGVSFQKMVAELDAGDVFASFPIPLQNENANELSTKLAHLGADEFPEVLKKIARGEISAQPQNVAAATFCTKIQKTDGRVSWSKDSAETLQKKLCAFTPWPGVWTTFGGQTLKLLDFEIARSETAAHAGEVFAVDKKVFVATRDGAITLRKVQLAGRRAVSASDFARGERGFIGGVLK